MHFLKACTDADQSILPRSAKIKLPSRSGRKADTIRNSRNGHPFVYLTIFKIRLEDRKKLFSFSFFFYSSLLISHLLMSTNIHNEFTFTTAYISLEKRDPEGDPKGARNNPFVR